MRDTLAVAKALADEKRLRALRALCGRELCVCQIIELLGLAPSTVSKHMSVLRQAGLVASRKCGRWVHYRLADTAGESAASRALRFIRDELAADTQIATDRKRLNAISGADLEKLCRKQRG